jgi:hypothetical protein
MENKQTAVEWLVTQLEGEESLVARIVGLKEYNQIVKQAKQMEKEQIKDARDSYINQILKVNDDLLIYGESKFKEITSEEYYNETYANDTTTGLPEEDSKRRAWHR